jgi:hypothetical protein
VDEGGEGPDPESLEASANISEVARRNGVARGVLTVWLRQFAAAARSKAPSFVPVRIAEESGGGTDGARWHAHVRARRIMYRPRIDVCLARSIPDGANHQVDRTKVIMPTVKQLVGLAIAVAVAIVGAGAVGNCCY